jgi:hypothetical protein
MEEYHKRVRRPMDIVCGKAISSIVVNPNIHTWIKIRDEMRNNTVS